MQKHLFWRGLILALVLGGGILFFLPTLWRMSSDNGALPDWWEKFLPSKTINLGLDLKGGIYLVMEVDLKVALNNSVKSTTDELRRELLNADIRGFQIESNDALEIQIKLDNPEPAKPILDLLSKRFSNLNVVSTSDSLINLNLRNEEISYIKDLTARQALETIRNRIDLFGVAEPDIRPQGEDRIVIQLPGMTDPQRAVELIGKTAVLEFKLVDNGTKTVEEALRDGPPPGTQILYERRINPATGEETRIPYLLRRQTVMTGNSLVDARSTRGGQLDTPMVSMTFDSRGAREFDEITNQYIGRNLAIVLDDVVYSAPVIKSRISEGRAVIEGSFTLEEARDLAVILRAGALLAPVTVLEERTVGPSLGLDSINQGLLSGIIGLSLILLFILFYYRWSGLIADIALLLNFPIILGALSAFGATLTLPGIFGLILTVAMAVDANVLIFERIREEIRTGKGPIASVSSGFNRAFWTIFDSNLTTIITAMVLYQFGTGPIRGFAVTLIIGILSSMFTAIFASRVIFDLVMTYRHVKKLSI